MCGRYTLATPADELIEAFDVPDLTFEYFARYNIAPGQPAPIVAEDRRGRRIGLLDWGFIPSWKDEPGRPMINARSESVATKPSFREAFRRRRCLVPADGFYEWKRPKDGRGERASWKSQPFWMSPTEEGPISFAAIWESWERPGAEPKHTFAILTADANAEVRAIHDRMPVVIAPDDRSTWLDRGSDLDAVARLLHPPPDGSFRARRVSTRVNATAEDDEGLIDPID